MNTMLEAGGGSLVISVCSANLDFIDRVASHLAAIHDRIRAMSPAVMATHTEHGNGVRVSIPGETGGSGCEDELGGYRACALFHSLTAF